jgi:hypothetical protein
MTIPRSNRGIQGSLGDPIARAKTMPPWFTPSALNALVPGDAIKRGISFRAQRGVPVGWSSLGWNGYRKPAGDYSLLTRRLRRGWTSERILHSEEEDQALSFAFGPMTLMSPTFQLAIQLAETCHPIAPDNLGFLHWFDVSPHS